MTGKTISVTKAVAAAGNYNLEDVISESASAGTAWTFAIGGSTTLGVRGRITKARVLCETTGQSHRLTLYLFSATPTSALNDNVANTAVLHADAANYLGRIDFPVLEDLGGDSETLASPSTTGNLPLDFVTDTTGNIYGILVTRDTFTGEVATDDYIVILDAEY